MLLENLYHPNGGNIGNGGNTNLNGIISHDIPRSHHGGACGNLVGTTYFLYIMFTLAHNCATYRPSPIL